MVASSQCVACTVTFTALKTDPDLISGPFLGGFVGSSWCPQEAAVCPYKPKTCMCSELGMCLLILNYEL